mmetsp:Transcript_229/g.729  ORF Transcript_229/g.729 Transcript_229/m.729 type:complete len:211 (-) Transcript_229:176-808(-)
MYMLTWMALFHASARSFSYSDAEYSTFPNTIVHRPPSRLVAGTGPPRIHVCAHTIDPMQNTHPTHPTTRCIQNLVPFQARYRLVIPNDSCTYPAAIVSSGYTMKIGGKASTALYGPAPTMNRATPPATTKNTPLSSTFADHSTSRALEYPAPLDLSSAWYDRITLATINCPPCSAKHHTAPASSPMHRSTSNSAKLSAEPSGTLRTLTSS